MVSQTVDGRDRRRGPRLVDSNGTTCTVMQWDGAIAHVYTSCEYNTWGKNLGKIRSVHSCSKTTQLAHEAMMYVRVTVQITTVQITKYTRSVIYMLFTSLYLIPFQSQRRDIPSATSHKQPQKTNIKS